MSEKYLIGALESIIVRCREGAKGTDWLPTIADIAERALEKAKSAPPAAVPDSVRRDALLDELWGLCLWMEGEKPKPSQAQEHINGVADRILAHPATAVGLEVVEALRGILELGRKDTSNPKYDSYYERARAALASLPSHPKKDN